MNKETFNDLINLEYPDDFKKLSDKENERYFTGDLLRISFHNEQKHILMSLSKSKDSFINRLVNAVTVISGALSNLEKNLKEYKLLEDYESTIFDKPAITACFSYTANNENIKQYGELSVFKEKKAFYIIYCLCRFEDKDESMKIFKEFRDSFK